MATKKPTNHLVDFFKLEMKYPYLFNALSRLNVHINFEGDINKVQLLVY